MKNLGVLYPKQFIETYGEDIRPIKSWKFFSRQFDRDEDKVLVYLYSTDSLHIIEKRADWEHICRMYDSDMFIVRKIENSVLISAAYEN